MSSPSIRTQPLREENVLGTTLRYLDEGSATRAAMIDNIVPPGAGVPPHVHMHEDEAFYVLDGTITIEVDGFGAHALGAGGYAYGPRGIWHSFRNETTQPARLLIFVSPGANLVAMLGKLAPLPMPPNMETLGRITAEHGVRMLPPPPG